MWPKYRILISGLVNNVPITFDKYGVIRSSSDVDRTCVIMWFSRSGEDLGMEPDVSVYDLAENVDMVFNPGNLVVAVDCGNDGGSKHRGVAGQVIQGYTLLLSLNCPISLSNTVTLFSSCHQVELLAPRLYNDLKQM